DDLRDHVARALHDHVVADTDVLAGDVLFVVESRARDRDASDLDRLKESPRIERARAADTDPDLVQPSHCGHRRPFVATRPAGPLVQAAETPVLVVRFDLDHDAVDLVVELPTAKLPRAARLGDLVDRLDALRE